MKGYFSSSNKAVGVLTKNLWDLLIILILIHVLDLRLDRFYAIIKVVLHLV